MQTCSHCQTVSPDNAIYCLTCNADLRQYSSSAVALQNFQKNPRVKFVRISVSADACPVCLESQGAYPKESVPHLPIEGCSGALGCHCYYEPVLEELFP